MKMWLPAIVVAMALASAACTQAAPAKSAPEVIIPYSHHAPHAAKFDAKMGKDANLRAEVQKKGVDVAFTEWMKRDHPKEFPTCVKDARKTEADRKHLDHIAEFNALLAKRGDLRASVTKKGFDATFRDWLKKEKSGQERTTMNR